MEHGTCDLCGAESPISVTTRIKERKVHVCEDCLSKLLLEGLSQHWKQQDQRFLRRLVNILKRERATAKRTLKTIEEALGTLKNPRHIQLWKGYRQYVEEHRRNIEAKVKEVMDFAFQKAEEEMHDELRKQQEAGA